MLRAIIFYILSGKVIYYYNNKSKVSPKMENEKSERGIHIGNVGGSVIGVGVTGSGNVIGENITINKQKLDNMPLEFAQSLVKFMEELKKYNIPPEQAKPIQDSLNDFTKEAEKIKLDEKISTVKQKNLNSKFSVFAEKVLKVLPKTAETIAAFTPLSPFSKLIGEGVQQLVESIQKDI
jgi:hypothetical protein